MTSAALFILLFFCMFIGMPIALASWPFQRCHHPVFLQRQSCHYCP